MWPPKNRQQLRSRTKKMGGKKWKAGQKKSFHFAKILLNETAAWDGYPVTNPLVTEVPRAPSPSLQPGVTVGTAAL